MEVTFFQNIGLLVMRLSQTTRGLLCKKCIDETFLRTSLISFFFGWWGVISFFVTLFTLPLNVVTWLRSLSLPAPNAALQAQGAWGSAGPSAPALDAAPYDEGAGYRDAAAQMPHATPGALADPFARPVVSAPPKSKSGRGMDMLAIAAMVLGFLAIGSTVLITMVGMGMILDPIDSRSADSGIFCIVSSSLVCGMPGLLGFAAGAYRLWAKQKAS
jgi:hypothetical protein